MEENLPKTGKYALNFGVILGVISVVFALMLYFQEMHYQQDWKIGVVNLVIMIVIIMVALYQFKKANGGFMTLGEALKIGVGLSLVAAIIGTVFTQILANVIDPEMMNKANEFQILQMQERGMTQEQIDGAVEMGKKFQSPVIQIAMGLIFSLFLGFVFSLIGGLIMKKNKPAH